MSALQFSWDADPETWPRVPSAFVLLANAFNEVGKALYPHAWTGQEGMPPPAPFGDKVRSAKQEGAKLSRQFPQQSPGPVRRIYGGPKMEPLPHSAHVLAFYGERVRRTWEKLQADAAAEAEANKPHLDRRRAAAEWIASRARDDELETWGLWVGGGGLAPVLLPAAVWIVNDDWTLFEHGKVKRWSVRPPMKQHEYFVLLSRESLDNQLAAYRSKALGEASSRARAEIEAESWLREQFEDKSTLGTGKLAFKAQAQSGIKGLSGEAFDRAWANAVKDYPERSAAGRKSGGKLGG